MSENQRNTSESETPVNAATNSLCQSSCLDPAEVSHLKEKYQTVYALLTERTECLRSLRKVVKGQRLEMENVKFEANQKVKSIQSFWRDKLFREQTRGGILVKRAIHNNSYA